MAPRALPMRTVTRAHRKRNRPQTTAALPDLQRNGWEGRAAPPHLARNHWEGMVDALHLDRISEEWQELEESCPGEPAGECDDAKWQHCKTQSKRREGLLFSLDSLVGVVGMRMVQTVASSEHGRFGPH
jgi:hypothetical protein